MKAVVIISLLFIGCASYVRPVVFEKVPYKYSQDAFYCYLYDGRNAFFSNFQNTKQFKAKTDFFSQGDTLFVDNDLEVFWKLKQVNYLSTKD